MSRLIVIVVCAGIALVYGYSLVAQMMRVSWPPAGNAFWFLAGVLGMGGYYAWRGGQSFRMVALHELNHAMMGWLLGAGIKSLGASGRMGGMVQYDDRRVWGKTLVILAPYFFQPIALLLAVVRLMVRPEFDAWVCVPMGAMWAMFYRDLFATLHGRTQDDIEKVGKGVAALVIFSMNVVVSGVILCAVSPETSVRGFLWDGPMAVYQMILRVTG